MVHAFLNMSEIYTWGFCFLYTLMCVSMLNDTVCERGFIFPWCISHYRRISILMVWCVWEWRMSSPVAPPTLYPLPVDCSCNKIKAFACFRGADLKCWERGVCLHDRVCVCNRYTFVKGCECCVCAELLKVTGARSLGLVWNLSHIRCFWTKLGLSSRVFNPPWYLLLYVL